MKAGGLLVMLAYLLLSQEKHHMEWLENHRFEVLDHFMPIPQAGSNSSPWRIGSAAAAFRSYRDLYLTIHEEYFRIDEQHPGPSLTATLVTPVEKSIQHQVLELRMAAPAASLRATLEQVKVDTVVLRDRDCPAIRSQLEALWSLEFAAPVYQDGSHPEVYWVYIETDGGQFSSVTTDGEHPLRRWAAKTMEQLRVCSENEAQN